MDAPSEAARAASARRTACGLLAAWLRLFKWRVVLLLLLAATAGLFLGSGGQPDRSAFLSLLFVGGLAAAGASAINEYLELEADAQMARTRTRPLVTGAIGRSRWVLVVGAVLIIGPLLWALPRNPALALWAGLGAVIYLGVYTLWLKPRTPLNVVIGGLAGSCAVLSGGAAANAWSDPGVLGLALLLFLWSPTHFWSLALACRDDYERVRVPMLPVVVAPRQAAMWNLIHAWGSAAVGLGLALHPALGLPYALVTLPGAGYMIARSLCLWLSPEERRAWRLFHASNFYLGLLLLTICVTAAL